MKLTAKELLVPIIAVFLMIIWVHNNKLVAREPTRRVMIHRDVTAIHSSQANRLWEVRSQYQAAETHKEKQKALDQLLVLATRSPDVNYALQVFDGVAEEDLLSLKDKAVRKKNYIDAVILLWVLETKTDNPIQAWQYAYESCWLQALNAGPNDFKRIISDVEKLADSAERGSLRAGKARVLAEALQGPQNLAATVVLSDLYHERRKVRSGTAGNAWLASRLADVDIHDLLMRTDDNLAGYLQYSFVSARYFSGRHGEAVEYLQIHAKDALEKDSRWGPYIRNVLALASMKIGRYDDAQEHFLLNFENETLSDEFRLQSLCQALQVVTESGDPSRIHTIRTRAEKQSLYHRETPGVARLRNRIEQRQHWLLPISSR